VLCFLEWIFQAIYFHLKYRCDRRRIQFTGGRFYKKDDDAHIEQKNWTHVREIAA